MKSPSLAVLCDDSARSTLTSSDFDLRGLQPDPRLDNLFQFRNSEDLDRFNLEARQNNRHPELFALYPPTDEVSFEDAFLSNYYSISVLICFRTTYIKAMYTQYSHLCITAKQKSVFSIFVAVKCKYIS